MMIDPEFDPTAGRNGMWFYGNVEARTIALLLDKLGPSFGVNNYYSNGAHVIHGILNPIEKDPAPVSGRPPTVAKATYTRKKSTRGKYIDIYDQVLDMWKADVPTRKIAERFGISAITVAAHIVAPARVKGDPRAVVRNAKIAPNRKAVSRYLIED